MSPELLSPYRIVEFAIFSGEYGFLSDIIKFFTKIFSVLSEWNIRLVILFSLSLQIILIASAPSRKRSSSFLLSIVWLAYLLADWAAGYCVGLISKSEAGKSAPTDQDHLMAFWSPFLLLHLGGPYTISAFALEDNELWLRHLFALVFQFVTGVRVFLSSRHRNTLLVPTIMVFVAGTAKYAERIAALSASSINKFRKSLVRKPDPGPNYAKLMEEHSSRKKAGLPVRIIRTPEHRYRSNDEAGLAASNVGDKSPEEHTTYLKQVQDAHYFFQKFRGLIVDMIYSSADRRESHQYFASKDDPENSTQTKKDDAEKAYEKAYRIIEIELDLMYEFFYTKASLARHPFWSIIIYICLISTAIALGFFTTAEKDGFHPWDVVVTYMLLYGALALDIVAFLMHFFADHTAALSVKSPIDSYGASFFRKSQIGFYEFLNEKILLRFLLRQKPSWSKLEEGPYKGCYQLSTRRWSGAISGHNLLKYSINQSVPRVYKLQSYCIYGCFVTGLYIKSSIFGVIKKLGGEDLLDQWRYKSRNPFLRELWQCIFEKLKHKSEHALKKKSDFVGDDPETIQRICSARGEWVLHNEELDGEIKETLKPFMEPNQVAFDESLLLWHIATDLCYAVHDDATGNEREISKLLSDYMLYLLVMQPNMMSAVAGMGQLRFKDTCEEAKRFFCKRNQLKQDTNREEMLRKAIKLLSQVPADVKPSEVKGDRSKSVLFDASRLVEVLKNLEVNKKWKFISSVWVELLSYAASQCRPTAHVQLLSKGGELVSFVWLLMVQMGLSTQFQILEGDARVKLIVG